MESMNTDAKYITFNRDEFVRELSGDLARQFEPMEIRDAIVIRRQDYFATAALAGYANSIIIAAKLTEDDKKRDELIAVADYFHRQSELAAEEGWKTPDV